MGYRFWIENMLSTLMLWQTHIIYKACPLIDIIVKYKGKSGNKIGVKPTGVLRC